MEDSKEINRVIIFNRLLRSAFGTLFISVGVIYYNEGGWAAILFGAIFLVTGFFRPKKCLEEGCDINIVNDNAASAKV